MKRTAGPGIVHYGLVAAIAGLAAWAALASIGLWAAVTGADWLADSLLVSARALGLFTLASFVLGVALHWVKAVHSDRWSRRWPQRRFRQ